MSARTGQFAQFCSNCASDYFILFSVVINAIILGVLAVMLWAMV